MHALRCVLQGNKALVSFSPAFSAWADKRSAPNFLGPSSDKGKQDRLYSRVWSDRWKDGAGPRTGRLRKTLLYKCREASLKTPRQLRAHGRPLSSLQAVQGCCLAGRLRECLESTMQLSTKSHRNGSGTTDRTRIWPGRELLWKGKSLAWPLLPLKRMMRVPCSLPGPPPGYHKLLSWIMQTSFPSC